MNLYWNTNSAACSAFQLSPRMNCNVRGKPTCTVTAFGERFFSTKAQTYCTRSMPGTVPSNKKGPRPGTINTFSERNWIFSE